ncbi:MAG: hypothetical protein P4L41_01595 [Flavipsychrobacter sp.]|nr:hypothetical protein [Flavipsychrobacter sp.]
MPITKNKVVLIVLAIASLAYASCRKKSVTAENPSAVGITVQSPLKGQMYRKGDTVNMSFSVTYSGELHGYYVQLIDTATENVLYESAADIHNDHFSVQLQWVDTCTQVKNLQLILNANLDHVGTEAADTVWITTMP